MYIASGAAETRTHTLRFFFCWAVYRGLCAARLMMGGGGGAYYAMKKIVHGKCACDGDEKERKVECVRMVGGYIASLYNM